MFHDYDDIPEDEEPGKPWPLWLVAFITVQSTAVVGVITWPLWGVPLQRFLGH